MTGTRGIGTGTRAARFARMGMLAAAALLAGACRDRGGETQAPREPVRVDSVPRRVEVRLYVARDWAWNEEDTLRVTVVNATEQPLGGDLNLFVGAPVEVLADSAARPGTQQPAPRSQATDAGVHVVFPLGTIAPGATGEFRQAVRTPPAPVLRQPTGPRQGTPRDTASRFAVRAWVTAADGREAAEMRDTIRIRAGSEVVAGGCGGVEGVAVTRYGVGPLRLDMRAGDVRSLCPEARDTTWQAAEGMTARGLRVRLAGHPVLVELSGQTVHRIVVDTAGLRTGVGVGVGSSVAELRGRYGRLCAGRGEGRIAVWTPAAPGISFGLDSTAVAAGADVDAAALPDSARVDEMWVRQGNDDCPRGD